MRLPFSSVSVGADSASLAIGWAGALLEQFRAWAHSLILVWLRAGRKEVLPRWRAVRVAGRRGPVVRPMLPDHLVSSVPMLWTPVVQGALPAVGECLAAVRVALPSSTPGQSGPLGRHCVARVPVGGVAQATHIRPQTRVGAGPADNGPGPSFHSLRSVHRERPGTVGDREDPGAAARGGPVHHRGGVAGADRHAECQVVGVRCARRD